MSWLSSAISSALLLVLVALQSAAGQSYCGETNLTSTRGTINSPNWPGIYSDNQDCEWTISTSSGSAVQLQFTHFETESGFDYVEIEYYDDASSRKVELKYQGSDIPRRMMANSNFVTVRFHSDGSQRRAGFRLLYETGLFLCGWEQFTSGNGNITFPRLPEHQNSSIRNCAWKISVPERMSVLLQFSRLEVDKCCDFIDIEFRQDGRTIRKSYTGSYIPAPLLVSSNNVTVRFRSSRSEPPRSFQLLYNAVPAVPNCPNNITEVYVAEGESVAKVEVTYGLVLFLSPGMHEVALPAGGCLAKVIVHSTNYPNTCPKHLSSVIDDKTKLGSFSFNAAGSPFQLELPQGEYNYNYQLINQNCSTKFVVYDGRLKRKLDFSARYDIKCSVLEKSRPVITAIARQKYVAIEQMCNGGCKKSKSDDVTARCLDDITTITWPTDKEFPGDVVKVPDSFLAPLLSSLKSKTFLDIIEYDTVPRVVYPLMDSDGHAVRPVLRPFCSNNSHLEAFTNSCVDV